MTKTTQGLLEVTATRCNTCDFLSEVTFKNKTHTTHAGKWWRSMSEVKIIGQWPPNGRCQIPCFCVCEGLGWDWMEGWKEKKKKTMKEEEEEEEGFTVGGAAGFYGRHKSLHDRHLFQSILTGVLQRKAKRWSKGKSRRCNIPLVIGQGKYRLMENEMRREWP